jgi:hypothetical protein
MVLTVKSNYCVITCINTNHNSPFYKRGVQYVQDISASNKTNAQVESTTVNEALRTKSINTRDLYSADETVKLNNMSSYMFLHVIRR